MSRSRRLASALVHHPYTRSTLVRRALISVALSVFWLLAGVSRLADGGRVIAGFLILGAVFFGVRAAAHGVVMTSLPPDEAAAKRSGNVDDT